MARPNEGAPPRAYRVFVASTFSDNDERRGLISEAITRAGMVPVLMDKQGAGALPPLDECLKKAREADLVVALLAWRYGSAAPGDADGRSYTECEIEAARDFRVFIIDPKAPIIVDEAFDPGPERWARAERLAKLKTRLGEAKLAAFWKETTLYAEVLEALRMWHAQQSLPQRDRRRRVAAGATPSDPARSSPPGSPTDATETWYRELLHERCSRLVLMGLEGAVLPVRREQLFVPLRIATGFAGLETPEYEDGTHAHHLLAHAGGGEAEVVVRRVFDEARLRGGRRGVVLLGDPGAGKTTVLQSCYLDLVESGPESYGLPSGTTPWLVYLRDLATSRKDLPSTLDETFRARWDVAPKGWFATRARADTVLLLLDGLDEIADEDERARVVDQIQAWLDSSPRRYAFLTSRYAGYHRRVRRASHLLELHLRFLSRVETHDLILRWFRAVEATTHPTPHEEPRSEPTATATEAERSATGSRAPLRSRRRQSADELAADLIESVDSLPASDRIVGLSRNPLLLGAICLVHRERGRLPRSRSTLYRTCIDILLQHWKQASGIKLKLSATEARSLLIPMAGFLHEVDGRTRATVKELAAGLRDRGMPDLERNALADFLRTVKDESGLVSGLGNGKFGFLHLGFQEYLAARDLVRRA